MRKQPVAQYDPWDFSREPGDRVYEPQTGKDGAWMFVESNGWGKRMSGELTPRIVKKNGRYRLAVLCDDGYWYWQD